VRSDIVHRKRPREREERHAERPARLVVHAREDVPCGVGVRRRLDREQDRPDEQDDGAQCRRLDVEPGDVLGRQAEDQARYKHRRHIYQLRGFVRSCRASQPVDSGRTYLWWLWVT